MAITNILTTGLVLFAWWILGIAFGVVSETMFFSNRFKPVYAFLGILSPIAVWWNSRKIDKIIASSSQSLVNITVALPPTPPPIRPTLNMKVHKNYFEIGEFKFTSLKFIQGTHISSYYPTLLYLIISGQKQEIYWSDLITHVEEIELELLDFLERAEHTKSMQDSFDKIIGE